ncbi:MAG: TonB-dependent receptor [Myxococcota bacterium]
MDVDVEEVTVEGERPVETATGRELDRDAVAAFPARSADELLRAMPGLQLSAHGGRGKAYQYLLRGFDAEHGADLAVTVDGVPLNEPSNVHGQGYLDLSFLPTRLVDGLTLTKGSYRAQDGDFAVTGAADYRIGLRDDGLLLHAGAGTDRTGAGGVAWHPAGRGPQTFAVAEGEGGHGVGEGRGYGQARLAAGVDGDAGRLRAHALAFAYHGRFDSPGVLRQDDLDAERIGFWEAYDVAGGGTSSRALVIGGLDADGDSVGATARAWAGARHLRLDQNFTGWLQDPVHGDGARQEQFAADTGARVSAHGLVYALHTATDLQAGADLRATATTLSERGIDAAGRPYETRFDADTRQLDAAAWGTARIVGGAWTLAPGVRADRLVLGLRDPLADDGLATSAAPVISPRGSASLRLAEPLTVYAAAGRGLRSPDVRGIADGDRAPVMVSTSAETGAQWTPGAFALSATAFSVGVSNELVFDHLVGRFLSAGRTRRLGVEAVAELRPQPWLHLQGDLTYTDGRFVADGTPIPYAPRWLAAAAAFVEGARIGRAQAVGGLRVWTLGPRPLPSGFASHTAMVGTLTGQLRWPGIELGVAVDDLFGQDWCDGEFVFPSWFGPHAAAQRAEGPARHRRRSPRGARLGGLPARRASLIEDGRRHRTRSSEGDDAERAVGRWSRADVPWGRECRSTCPSWRAGPRPRGPWAAGGHADGGDGHLRRPAGSKEPAETVGVAGVLLDLAAGPCRVCPPRPRLPGDVACARCSARSPSTFGPSPSLGVGHCYTGPYATGRVTVSSAVLAGWSDGAGEERPVPVRGRVDQDVVGIPFPVTIEAGAPPAGIASRFDPVHALSFVDWADADTDGDGVLTVADAPWDHTVPFGVVSTPSWSLSTY